MELELKHLAPYLPYGLNIGGHGNNVSILKYKTYANDLKGISINGVLEDWHVKPILRPLSDLTKEVEIDGKKFSALDELLRLSNFNISKMSETEKNEYIEVVTEIETGASYRDIEKLIEWHFDVFGLIEKGLAIDINTLNK